MGQARDVLDQMTKNMVSGDIEGVAGLYAENATATTPDQGVLRGRDQIVAYLKQMIDAFSELDYQPLYAHEAGNTAIDEGFLVGTHSRPLEMPDGGSVPPTGKRIRVRSSDAATVEDGQITNHRFYFDQMEFLGQLGLLPDMPA